MTTAADAQELITKLNQAWPAGDLATVSASYHPQAVLLPPDLGAPIRGRDDITDTYALFNASATLEGFEETAIEIFDFESSQAVHLNFTLAYELDGTNLEDRGLEIYLLSPHAGELKIVWRQQIVLASDTR